MTHDKQGWIKHDGRPIPCDELQAIEVKTTHGLTMPIHAEEAYWRDEFEYRLLCPVHERDTLAKRVEELEAERRQITGLIPMNFLQKHDAAGATSPTSQLDVVAALRDFSKWRWAAIDKITELEAKATQAHAQGYNEGLEAARKALEGQ